MSRAVAAALATVDGWVAEGRPVRAAAVLVEADASTRPVASTRPAASVRTPAAVTGWGPADMTVPIASVSKLVTALAVLVAVEEGSLTLDRPAGPPGSTVAHLLAHASGLAPDDEIVIAPPATRRIYSTSAFAVLARTLEEATGIAFPDYVRAAVIEPLGMAATTVDGHPGSGYRSSAADLARFAAELLAPRLVDPETLAGATRPWWPGLAGVLPGFGRQDPNPWGLGFEIRGGKAPHWTGRTCSTTTFGHFGRSGSFLWVDPATGCSLVVVTDTDFGRWALDAWPDLADAVLAGRHPLREGGPR